MSFEPWIAPFPDDGQHRVLLSDCGGRVLSGFCAVPSVSAELFHGEGRSGCLLTAQTIGLQTVTLPVLWRGITSSPRSWAASGSGSRWAVEAGIRQFEGALVGSLVLNPGDGYLYQCSLTGISAPEWLGAAACRKTYTLQGVKTWPLQTLAFSGALVPKVNCTSTLPKTDCILTLSNSFNKASDVVIQVGSTVFTVSGEGGTLTGESLLLDGINKRIRVDGADQACIWSWSEFPWLAPGENELRLSINGVGAVPTGTLSWYPSFL